MLNIESNILDISHNHYNYLLNLKNVHAVGLGYKRINNINTFEPCIHVLVEEKINSEYLTKNNIIPKYYMGIKTDVIKVKRFKTLSSDDEEDEYDDAIPQKMRPLEGGCSIVTTEGSITGTLGCFITKYLNNEKLYFLLSNAHVLSELNDIPIGTPVIQPSNSLEDDEAINTIATLWNYMPLRFIHDIKGRVNYMDAAIAKIIDPNLISNKIYGLDKVNGIANATLNENVKKVGYVTGLTTGTIMTIGVTENIDILDEEEGIFKDQIVANLKSKDGDSGSVVLNDENKVVALLFAGSDEEATMTDINVILKKFNAEIFTG